MSAGHAWLSYSNNRCAMRDSGGHLFAAPADKTQNELCYIIEMTRPKQT
jgi:hypothetical protein